ncbi:hypothetical protein C8N46_10765 [Kordia periserrulae]|uniref:Tetratricopeptide repeat protein n=1 Tax=Kordia periserrulae TaxID=701523 RepID=A0A2T6BVG1_9FLAO|nr:hypothetical protein [Kordia periserrulae]PTX60059.1 hypothetical protein C8N46_10765 [Kordia periserrulae]
MKIEDDILIEKFLKNTLSDEERTSFMKRMASDTSFKEHVILEQQLLEVLGDNYWSFATNEKNARVVAYKKILESEETQQLKTTIAETLEQHKQQASQSSVKHAFSLSFILKVAAVFLIFCISVFWYFSSNTTIDYAAASKRAWDKNIGLDFALRSTSADTVKVSLEKALYYYSHQEYDSVLSTLKPYRDANHQYKDILLMRALAHYRLHYTKTAMTTLDSVAIHAPKIAKWYRGLMYLDQHKIEEASLFLELPSEANQEIKLKE